MQNVSFSVIVDNIKNELHRTNHFYQSYIVLETLLHMPYKHYLQHCFVIMHCSRWTRWIKWSESFSPQKKSHGNIAFMTSSKSVQGVWEILQTASTFELGLLLHNFWNALQDILKIILTIEISIFFQSDHTLSTNTKLQGECKVLRHFLSFINPKSMGLGNLYRCKMKKKGWEIFVDTEKSHRIKIWLITYNC